ncbi:MbtH family protein [Janthinobacterium agaricidamnosum]|uniref:MbtH-like domain-containing protein n=1 Tax=Janthinobacterium agaricidamnosum NBRC 102515 = DSM 9628 TaxID=1349767 RepID=W0V3W4_9BURK|nr:MbtH family NRPS accessory protein [Janthinobacterium agaricidamnosum]CDG82038.1 putative uncharacterized protein [Janthinobacterium agaricidamnosum NBRC 102515 = DSM 9628]
MASEDLQQDEVLFQVVVNHEEQYSIWPQHKLVPHGWSGVGTSGDKATCLEWIRKVWVDMRPLSVR